MQSDLRSLSISMEDGAGNRKAWSFTAFDGASYATGASTTLTKGHPTRVDKYATCTNGGTGTGIVTTTTAYNGNGDVVGTTDADANGGIGGHTGCTVGSTSYSICVTFDSVYGTLPQATKNALNEGGSNTYGSGSGGGYGLWATGETNPNNGSSTFTYDTLGRTLTTTRPGETAGLVTTSASYTVWCATTGPSAPCLENDATQRINDTTTATTRSFYDGWGHLIETRSPGPNGQDVVRYAQYDVMGHQIYQSQPYFVTAYTGGPGAAAYSTPDNVSQSGTTTTYDGVDRVVQSVAVDHATTNTSYAAACNISGTSDAACYSETMTTDPNGHQAMSVMDAQGRDRYEQRFTGTGPYTLYTTGSYAYDYLGNMVTINQPGSLTTSFTYDMLGRKTGMTDADSGSWSYTYDPDGNLTQQSDPRGASGTVYVGYDGLNRQTWRSTHSDGSSPFTSYTYDSTANGNDGIGELTSETLPAGQTKR